MEYTHTRTRARPHTHTHTHTHYLLLPLVFRIAESLQCNFVQGIELKEKANFKILNII